MCFCILSILETNTNTKHCTFVWCVDSFHNNTWIDNHCGLRGGVIYAEFDSKLSDFNLLL